MSRLIISLGEQNFSAPEDVNNAKITNYEIFFIQYAHPDAETFLQRENRN